MLDTAAKIYEEFLIAIKRSDTSVVLPAKFVSIWNVWAMMDWISSNTSLKEGSELTQKQMDDLEGLRRKYAILPDTVNTFLKPTGTTIGYPVDAKNVVNTSGKTPIQKYLRALYVKFIIDYDTAAKQECSLTGDSDWLKASLLRSDEENVIEDSPYRKPKDSKLYYYFKGGEIIMRTDIINGSDALYILLDYYTYPNEMSYSSGSFSYTIDLGEEQLKEVLAEAVRIHLERSQDPRYQTWLHEQGMRQITEI